MADISVVFEDRFILVLEKEAGLIVNRSLSAQGRTLQDQLADYFALPGKDLGIGGRAGIVHRLDKETSGLLVVAKEEESYFDLIRQFKERRVEKKYFALVHGQPAQDRLISVLPVSRHPRTRMRFAVLPDGREARTDFEVLKRLRFKSKIFQDIIASFPPSKRKFLRNNAYYYSLFLAKPKTGRTHQIRVHAKSANHPLVSDPLYGQKLYKFDRTFCPRLFLHACQLGFFHPRSGRWMEFKSSLPKDLVDALSFLEE